MNFGAHWFYVIDLQNVEKLSNDTIHGRNLSHDMVESLSQDMPEICRTFFSVKLNWNYKRFFLNFGNTSVHFGWPYIENMLAFLWISKIEPQPFRIEYTPFHG